MSTSTTPVIKDFVLYAERTLTLKKYTNVCGGDLGIRSVARLEHFQLQLDERVAIEECHAVYSPSTALGRDVILGRIFTNGLKDDGIAIGPILPYPALVMPPIPLTPSHPCLESTCTIALGETVVLAPGTYGSFLVLGRLYLVPGEYSFCSILVGDRAELRATRYLLSACNTDTQAEPIRVINFTLVNICNFINTGRHSIVAPLDDDSPARFQILVSGFDTNGRPPASFGEHSKVEAILLASHGTLAMADHVHAAGAFAAFDISVGEHVEVKFIAGLGAISVLQHGSKQLSGYYGVNPNLNVAPIAGPVPPQTLIDLTFGLPVQNPIGLQRLISGVSDPKNAQFRKYISQAQFATAFGAPASDYQALQSWATTNGFTVKSTYPTNLLLSINGTAETIQNALFVNLVFRYRSDGSTFVAVDRDPSLDLSISILEIGGLKDYFVPRAAGQNGTGTGAAFRAADLRNAYLGVSSPNQALDGTGQVVGILGLDTLQLSDVTGYAGNQLPASGQPKLKAPNVTINNSTGTIGTEGTGDVECVLAMAPGAQIIFFHGSTGITTHADDVLAAMANYSPALTVATCSWMFGRSNNSQQAIDQMAAQGVSFFVCSGDYGDVGDPQSNQDMNNITLVGGTILNTNPLTSPLPSPSYPTPFYAFEQTWNQASAPQSKAVTGGGVMDGNNKVGNPYGEIIGIGNPIGASNCYCWPYPLCCGSGIPIPDYQVAAQQSPLGGNGGSQQWRNYPDVAMVASNIEFFYQGAVQQFAGTSASSPLWAGYIALVNQNSVANGQGLGGFLNPTLYDIYLTRGTAVDLYSLCFNDIHDGVSNSDGWGPGFISVPGYDLCTGLGSPTPALLSQLSTLQPLTPNQPLVLIEFAIITGNDNAGGGQNGSNSTATVFLKDGGTFTVTMRNTTNATWDNWTTHAITFPIPMLDSSSNPIPPLTPVSGITGAQINLVQNNPDIAADNWDVFAFAVTLKTPGFPEVRQIALIGDQQQDGHTGLVRLTKSSGSSPVYPSLTVPANGTALTQIKFTVSTGVDNLGGGANGSNATATVFLSPGHSFTVFLSSSWDAQTTNHVIEPIPAQDDQGTVIPVMMTGSTGINGVQLHLNQSNPDLAADNWDVLALEMSLLSADSSEEVIQIFLLGGNTLQDGSQGLVRLSKNKGNSGAGPDSPVYPVS